MYLLISQCNVMLIWQYLEKVSVFISCMFPNKR